MTKTFIIIDNDSSGESAFYPTDTDAEILAAREALLTAGEPYAALWFGEPNCPDAYRSDKYKLWAATGSAYDRAKLEGAK